jgi:tRNA A-37 threonylcarbamoyl transferase component Bud32
VRAPPGFAERRAGSIRLVADASLGTALEDLGLLAPDAWAHMERTASGSEGRGATVILEPREGERLLVRRVLHGGLLGPLLGASLLGLARPLRELAATSLLRSRGAPVPRPAFVWGEHRIGPFYRAAVATWLEEESQDALGFLESDPSPARILRAAEAAGRAVRRLHDAGGRHADLHVKNLLLRERQAETECIVIDLDRIRVAESLGPRRRMQELMRLMRSLLKRRVLATVGPRAVARFFGAYAGRDRELRRALLAHLPRERLRVALHATRYKSWVRLRA